MNFLTASYLQQYLVVVVTNGLAKCIVLVYLIDHKMVFIAPHGLSICDLSMYMETTEYMLIKSCAAALNIGVWTSSQSCLSLTIKKKKQAHISLVTFYHTHNFKICPNLEIFISEISATMWSSQHIEILKKKVISSILFHKQGPHYLLLKISTID